MKEITIKLKVTEEQEKELQSLVVKYTYENQKTIFKRGSLKQCNKEGLMCEKYKYGTYPYNDQLMRYHKLPKDCFEKGSDFDIDKKDEYTLLKEKCIELGCKRLGVDKLSGILQLKFEHDLNLTDIALLDLNRFYDVNKEVTRIKEENIDKMKAYIGKIEKELKEKIKVTETCNIKDKVEMTYIEDRLIKVRTLAKDEIFDKYKDMLTKEQIKKLYKN